MRTAAGRRQWAGSSEQLSEASTDRLLGERASAQISVAPCGPFMSLPSTRHTHKDAHTAHTAHYEQPVGTSLFTPRLICVLLPLTRLVLSAAGWSGSCEGRSDGRPRTEPYCHRCNAEASRHRSSSRTRDEKRGRALSWRRRHETAQHDRDCSEETLPTAATATTGCQPHRRSFNASRRCSERRQLR